MYSHICVLYMCASPLLLLTKFRRIRLDEEEAEEAEKEDRVVVYTREIRETYYSGNLIPPRCPRTTRKIEKKSLLLSFLPREKKPTNTLKNFRYPHPASFYALPPRFFSNFIPRFWLRLSRRACALLHLSSSTFEFSPFPWKTYARRNKKNKKKRALSSVIFLRRRRRHRATPPFEKKEIRARSVDEKSRTSKREWAFFVFVRESEREGRKIAYM